MDQIKIAIEMLEPQINVVSFTPMEYVNISFTTPHHLWEISNLQLEGIFLREKMST